MLKPSYKCKTCNRETQELNTEITLELKKEIYDPLEVPGTKGPIIMGYIFCSPRCLKIFTKKYLDEMNRWFAKDEE